MADLKHWEKKGVYLQFQLRELLTTLTIKAVPTYMKAHRCKMANESKMADHSTSIDCFLQEAKQSPYLEIL